MFLMKQQLNEQRRQNWVLQRNPHLARQVEWHKKREQQWIMRAHFQVMKTLNAAALFVAGFSSIAVFQVNYALDADSTLVVFFSGSGAVAIVFSLLSVAITSLLLLAIFKRTGKEDAETFWSDNFETNANRAKRLFVYGGLFFSSTIILMLWVVGWDHYAIIPHALLGSVPIVIMICFLGRVWFTSKSKINTDPETETEPVSIIID
jgi:archaellum biogenesis protein FlaJ (TadC family)